MNNFQRDLLSKALADIAKGIFIGAILATATDKLTFYEGWYASLASIAFYLAAHFIAGGYSDE